MAARLPEMRDDGFTLIEVLVAFVITMLALGLVYEGVTSGLQATRVSMRMQEAISRAQSHLAAVGHGMKVMTTTQNGDDGSGFHWRVNMTPVETSSGSTPTMTLYRVEVSISWPDANSEKSMRDVTLTTYRLGAATGASR